CDGEALCARRIVASDGFSSRTDPGIYIREEGVSIKVAVHMRKVQPVGQWQELPELPVSIPIREFKVVRLGFYMMEELTFGQGY
ncbi:MAG: hypothetical protein R6U37_06680, partial [Dehalococcoidia bacterium]